MIKNKRLQGQSELEAAHQEVGGDVRELIVKNTGKRPEDLPCEMPIDEMKKVLKQAHKELKKIDEREYASGKSKK